MKLDETSDIQVATASDACVTSPTIKFSARELSSLRVMFMLILSVGFLAITSFFRVFTNRQGTRSKEKLGFKEEVRWTVATLPGTKLVYLELNGFRFEIVGSPSISTQATPTSFQKSQSIEGYGLFCFEVEDVDAVLAELKRRGVPTRIPARTYRLSNYWRRIGTILDNNGNMIEFAEPLTTTKPSQ